MKELKELYEEYKSKNDCTRYEFLQLYKTLNSKLSRLGYENKRKELLDMKNQEYAIVNGWPTSNGSEQIYDKERLKGFNKMKTILKQIMSENKCNN